MEYSAVKKDDIAYKGTFTTLHKYKIYMISLFSFQMSKGPLNIFWLHKIKVRGRIINTQNTGRKYNFVSVIADGS